MPNLIPINPNDFNPIPNANLFPYFLALNEAFTWNVQSGSGTGSNITYKGDRVFRVQASPSVGVVINSGGTQTNFTATSDGRHYFHFAVAEESSNTTSTGVKATLFVNGTPVDFTFFALIDSVGSGEYRHFLGELDLSNGDVVGGLQISVTPNDVGTGYKLLFKDFKIEVASGIPTIYSPPALLGFNGTFLTNDDPAKTATVINGIITTIV